MFPPVDDSVLENNPDFAHLYKTLTTTTLNPNGTTRVDPASKARSAVRKELDTHRLQAAKRHLLISALTTALPPQNNNKPSTNKSTNNNDLPPSLLDLLLILPSILTSPPDPQILHPLLTSPPLSSLPTLLPSLGTLLSATLHETAISLARVSSPTTNPSYLHRSIPLLPQTYTQLQTTILTTSQTLLASRLRLGTRLTNLLSQSISAQSLLIRTLEAKNGVIARSLELRAAEMALEARQVQADTLVARENVRRQIYAPDVVNALKRYETHLVTASRRLEQAVRDLRDDLAGYGVGVKGQEERERRMREIARVYRELGREVGEVKADLERLERG